MKIFQRQKILLHIFLLRIIFFKYGILPIIFFYTYFIFYSFAKSSQKIEEKLAEKLMDNELILENVFKTAKKVKILFSVDKRIFFYSDFQTGNIPKHK